VQILETASELKEVGAAITCGPGSVSILRRYGVHLEREGGVALQDMNLWSGQGKLLGNHSFGAREALGEDIVSA
jgi:2-polyprenyl-6-methoxyphenol hydroxylase-like FAD-dependent oxidoreductase